MKLFSMKKYVVLCLLCTSTYSIAAPKVTEKSSERVQVGYSFGYFLGKNNTNALDDLDLDSFTEGFRQGYTNQKPALTNEQMNDILIQYKKKIEAAELDHFKKLSNQHLQEGNAFLQENAKKSGVITTSSGLQYSILTQGQGQKPSANSQVEVHYEGRLLDDTVFDSSIARSEPVTLPLNRVIKGWQEGLQLMNEGSKYRFFVPAKLAYGETGSGDAIPPNSTLIFDIELLKVMS